LDWWRADGDKEVLPYLDLKKMVDKKISGSKCISPPDAVKAHNRSAPTSVASCSPDACQGDTAVLDEEWSTAAAPAAAPKEVLTDDGVTDGATDVATGGVFASQLTGAGAGTVEAKDAEDCLTATGGVDESHETCALESHETPAL